MYKRFLDLNPLLKHRSLFLFGPRQTGKSTLLRTQFPNAFFVNLLEADTFREYSTRPETLRTRVEAQKSKIIVVDEVQKLPELLNEVHNLIENNKTRRFILTGSSARALKKSGVNLLGGRAIPVYLFPLVSWELGFENLDDTFLWGSLPSIVNSEIKKEDLKSYVGTYLKEEIRDEGAVRNLSTFGQFLETAALCSGQLINYSAIGNDAGVKEKSVKDYFQILSDTFLGRELLAFKKSKSRKTASSAKFYLFDNGIWNALLGRFSLSTKTREFGDAMEHRVFQELSSYLSYNRSDEPLNFWRPERQESEIDFLIGARIGIEVKSTGKVDKRDFKGLDLYTKDSKLQKKIIVCNEKSRQKLNDHTFILPFKAFCEDLWSGELLK